MINNIGIALSGGGQQGLAHLGVIQFFKEKNYHPNIIAGTSAGAIATALWVSDIDITLFNKDMERAKTEKIFHFRIPLLTMIAILLQRFLGINFKNFLPPGFLKGDAIHKALKKITNNKLITDVNIPIAINSVDLNTGEEVIFTNRPSYFNPTNAKIFSENILLADAVRASISLPGIFHPFKLQGMALADGGMAKNLPISHVRSLGGDKIIGVDLGLKIPYKDTVNQDIISISERAIGIMTRNLTTATIDSFDLKIEPNIPAVGIGDLRRFAEIVRKGYEACIDKEKELAELFIQT